MAVTVTRSATPADLAPTTKHDNGNNLLILDGHLLVQAHPDRDMDSTVAVYSPGKWVSAVVEDDKKTS